jgi:hypothetical protein
MASSYILSIYADKSEECLNSYVKHYTSIKYTFIYSVYTYTFTEYET